MSRPKTVRLDTFPLYNKFHTKKIKMYSGVELTSLFPMKETEHFHVSCEVWAFCSSKIKVKKPNQLSVNIPILTDVKAIKFLNDECWKDYVEENKTEQDFIESINMLKNFFPNHDFKYFYEFESLVAAFCHGSFVKYEDGNEIKDKEHQIKQQKYYTHKYNKRINEPHIKVLFENYRKEEDEEKMSKLFEIYYEAEREYVFKHFNLTDTFIEICKNAVCLPMAFSKNTAEWSKEEYGKLIGYAHAGEIFFVATSDTVFFSITRHY